MRPQPWRPPVEPSPAEAAVMRRVKRAKLALATILQAYTGASDEEAMEAMMMDRRWQLVLGCPDAEEPPFSKSTLVAFRKRLIEHEMDRHLVERTV